jgi:hypothetical protein
MSETPYCQLRRALAEGGVESVLSQLVGQLRDEHRYHELFEALRMRVRHALALPLLSAGDGDDLDETTRRELEEGLLRACREVGMLLLEEGKVRDGWVYLRPLGEKLAVAGAYRPSGRF